MSNSHARFRRYAAIFSFIGISACSGPLLDYRTDRPAIVQTSLSRAGIIDGRPAFRASFCGIVARELKGDDSNCEQWLTKLSDEAPALTPSAVPVDTPPSFDIVFISGIFGECLGEKTQLLSDGIAGLQQSGYRTSYAPVRGRASSDENANIIRDHILKQSHERPARKLVIVSYSKGTADLITALNDYPELSEHVIAVLSLAGVVNGSPLADYFSDFYAKTVANIPYSRCAIVDKLEMNSISRAKRQNWLTQKSLPPGILYFSIVGVPRPDRVSALLKPFYDRLAYVDPLNDGQVLYYDAVLPGSTLLAYVNADHWAIALPFESTSSAFPPNLINKNHFPRTQMLRAAITTVEARLATAPHP